MKQESKTPKKPLIFYYLIAMLVLLLLNALVFPSLLSPRVKEVSYDQFLSLVEQKEVKQVAIEDDVMDAAMLYWLITALSYPFLAVYNALWQEVKNAK